MIIPKKLDYILNLQKRKDSRQRIIKVYNALLYKKGKRAKWFDVPSSYLEKVSPRYYKVIQLLIDYKIIEFLSKGNEYKYNDIFSSELYQKKFYAPKQCMKYRFLINIEEGDNREVDLDFSNLYDSEKWYIKTKYSLDKIGIKQEDIRIKRDSFSRRLHTNITGLIPDAISYRNMLSGGEYYTIDSKTSQPRLLWITMKEIGFNDKNLNEIFENDLDFYDYIIQRIPAISTRDEAKELFTSWVNGNGYVEIDKAIIRDIFPVANTYMRNYKTDSYINICRLLQYKEATIFVDDLLNNCPVEFCLSIHDCLVVKKEDVNKVLEYCKASHPELVYVAEEIKPKN